MTSPINKIDVYLETGQKRTFACAVDWPGWCRSGRDDDSALQALLEYGPRYAGVLRPARLGFQAPVDASAFVVQERLKGNATTDFGAPGMPPSSDARSVDSKELKRFEKLLKACWQSFDAMIQTAAGKTLRTGPRGGGRELEAIVQHMLDADGAYIRQVGWKLQHDNTIDIDDQLNQTRQAIRDGLTASARGEIPAKGPRGGVRWSPRYFVRRVAWHTLDHLWEIEDRLIEEEEEKSHSSQ